MNGEIGAIDKMKRAIDKMNGTLGAIDKMNGV